MRRFGRKTFTSNRGEIVLTILAIGALVGGGMYAYNHIANTYKAAGKAEQTAAQIEHQVEQKAKAVEGHNQYKVEEVERKKVLKKALKKHKDNPKERAKAMFKSLERK